MKRPKKYLHLHTRLDEFDQQRLRQGFAAARVVCNDGSIRNYADFTRMAIARFASEVVEQAARRGTQ